MTFSNTEDTDQFSAPFVGSFVNQGWLGSQPYTKRIVTIIAFNKKEIKKQKRNFCFSFDLSRIERQKVFILFT